MFKLLFTLSMISLFLSLIYHLCFDTSFQIQDPKWRNDWSVKVLFGNKDLVTDNWSWVQVTMCIFITFATLRTIFGLKTDARLYYKKYARSGSHKHDFEWLKSRTIHVRGLLKNDITGEFLEKTLDNVLQNTDSKILSIVVIPDYKKLTELEEKRKDWEDLSQLLGVREPTCMRLFV